MSAINLTLNNIIKEVYDISSAHLNLKSFHYGNFLDIYQSGKIEYNTLLMNVNNASLDQHYISLTLELMTMDKIFNDESSSINVESDTLQILQDIFSVIQYSDRWQSFSKVNQVSSMRKFKNKGEDKVTGWAMDIQLNVRRQNGICDLPIEGYDYDGDYSPICAGVTITEDGIFKEIVASGGTFNYNTEGDPAGNVLNGDTLTDIVSGTTKTFTIQDADTNPVTVTQILDSATAFVGEVEALGAVYYSRPLLTQKVQGYLYDEKWRIDNGANDYTNAIPNNGRVQRVDYTVGLDRLFYFNVWGHKFRFTGINGGYYNPDDGLYYDVDGVLSDKATEFPPFSGTQFWIVDHLDGFMKLGVRAGGQSFDTGWTFVATDVRDGYSDFFTPSVAEWQQMNDPSYDTNLYAAYRPPWAYDQGNHWSCTMPEYYGGGGGTVAQLYSVQLGGQFQPKGVGPAYANVVFWREHLTGTIPQS